MRKLKATIKKYWGELVFVFSNTYSLGISTVAGLVATAFIAPSDMGVIQTVLLVQVYLSFLHLGVFNGLNRNLAYYKAKGDKGLVQDMVNTTYSVSYIISFIGALVALGLFIYYLIEGKTIVYLLSSLLLFVLLVFQPITNAIETTYRSGQEFKRLGIIKNIETTVYAGLTIFPIFLSYIGKVIADSLKSVFGFFMRYRKRPYKQTGGGSRRSFILLVKTGFPILVSGYLWTLFTACDRTYIANFIGMEEMGLYSISNYVMLAVMAIPMAVNTLLYPKAAATYGATGKVQSLKIFWKRSLLLYIILFIPLCSLLYFILPYLVEAFMPKYVGGIRAAQFSLLTCMTFVYKGPSVLFGTLRRNLLDIILITIAILLFWGIALLFKDQIRTIESVSVLRFGISLIHMILVLIVSYGYIR